ncbi:MAG: hypothetical protein NTW74_01695, partial [Acidobacteria bacterium]|nr:hypothetical protein [Acidobacteriota bacterium]
DSQDIQVFFQVPLCVRTASLAQARADISKLAFVGDVPSLLSYIAAKSKVVPCAREIGLGIRFDFNSNGELGTFGYGSN